MSGSFRRPMIFAVLGVVFAASQVPAAETIDPLRLISNQADLIIEVRNPRQLIDAYYSLDAVKSLLQLEPLRDLYDSTYYRRFLQLVAYYEKELGAPWPELMDRLAGNGIVAGLKFGPKPPLSIVVVQSRDEALLKRFVDVSLKIVEDELARQEDKDKVERGKYRDVDTVRVGKDLWAASVGSALLLANSEIALHAGIDLARDQNKKSLVGNPGIAEARKLVGDDALVKLWLNLETVKKAPEAKDIFKLPRNEGLLTVFFGGWLDLAGRSPFLAAGLFSKGQEVGYRICLPRGRDGMTDGLSVHIPPKDLSASRPLLKPKNVLYSANFYLDVGKFWEQRTKLFNEKQVKDFERVDKESGKVLLGTPVHKLLLSLGSFHRVVAVDQPDKHYNVKPTQPIPAFAAVLDVHNRETFEKDITPLLRAAGFLASTVGGAKLTMTETKVKESTLISYRFQEDAKLPNYNGNYQFNFSPSFALVGNQFVISSTEGLGLELVTLVANEGMSRASSSPLASNLYSEGGAQYLDGIADLLLAQTILDRAASPAAGRRQVQQLIDWVRKLGVLQSQMTYDDHQFKYEVRLIPSR